MKKKIIYTLFIISATVTVILTIQYFMNRPADPVEQQVDARLQQMTTNLSLTEKQQKPIRQLLIDLAEKQTEIQKSTAEKMKTAVDSVSKVQVRQSNQAETEKISNEFEAELKKVLTPEQYAIRQANMQKAKEQKQKQKRKIRTTEE